MIFKPSRVYLGASAAEGITFLNAFDNALMKIGIADYNLVKVTSVFPPGARLVDAVDVPAGSVVPCVYTSLAEEKTDEVIAAAIGVGIPEDSAIPGVVMEVSGRYPSERVQSQAKRMVIDAMERRGIEKYGVKSVAVEHRVVNCGCTVAILLLLP